MITTKRKGVKMGNEFIEHIRKHLQELSLEERWLLLFADLELKDKKKKEEMENKIKNMGMCKLINQEGKLK